LTFQEPVLFLKPTSSYVQNGGTIEIPHPLESLHYEVELAVVIGKKARDVKQVHAMDFVEGTYSFQFFGAIIVNASKSSH
jgi:acylpyruvate hydrolase